MLWPVEWMMPFVHNRETIDELLRQLEQEFRPQVEAKGLRLGEEWHINRISMLSSRAISDPNRDHPMWDSQRIKALSFELLRTGRVKVDGLVAPIVPFEQSAEAYRRIDEHPEESVKLGVVYG